jgi:hypothetical protein
MGLSLLRTLRHTARSSSARTSDKILEIQSVCAGIDRRS